MTLVLVQYDFDYTAKDGRLVSIKPNESYILVAKTNEHWWRVRRDRCSRPFYVPAQYVREIPGGSAPPEGGYEATASMPPPRGASGEGGRFSTLGFSWGEPEMDRPEQTSSAASSSGSQQNGRLELYPKPAPRRREQSASSLQVHEPGDDMEFPPPPDLPELGLTPEANLPEFDGAFEAPESEFRENLSWETADGGSSTDPFTDQVKFSCCLWIFHFYSFSLCDLKG